MLEDLPESLQEELISLRGDRRFKNLSQYFDRVVGQKLEFLVRTKLANQESVAEFNKVQGEINGIREVLGLPDQIIEARS